MLIKRNTKAFIYSLTSDHGSAPNPYGNMLSLALCKPLIRKNAQPGDMVLGITGSDLAKNRGYGIIWIGEVDQAISFNQYHDSFPDRIPRENTPNWFTGDNIYTKTGNNFNQIPNPSHDERSIEHDTKVDRVLIFKNFTYFGNKPLPINNSDNLILNEIFGKGRIGHRTKPISHPLIDSLSSQIEWQGILNPPSDPLGSCKDPNSE